MADDRPVPDPLQELADLRRSVEDMRTTLMARTGRLPTGFVMGTLLLNGQTVSRVTYAVLWKWVTDHGLVGTGFGNGDGSTTFTLPDVRAKVLRGVSSGGSVGELVGSDSINLNSGQIPSHNHTFGTNSSGSHGGHFPAQNSYVTPSGSSWGLAAWNDGGSSNGSHSHSGTTDNTGSGNGVDVRQSSFGLNFVIFT